MARDYVRDREAVQDLNAELIKSVEFIEQQEGAAKKLLNTIGGVSKELNKSGNFSEKNVKQADLLAKAGQASLKFSKSKSTKDKEAFDNIVKQYNTYRDLGGEQIAQLDNIIKQTNEIKVQEGLLSKIKISQSDIKDALSDQIPFGRQLSQIFDKKASKAKKIGAALLISIGILKQFADRTKVIGDEFGALGMNNEKFKTDILSASTNAKRLGMDTKEVVDVIKDLTTNFGFSRDEALGLTNQILDTSRAIGVSNQEGTKLIGLLTQIGGLSFESANNFAKQTALLAQANGAAPNAVIKDIADSSETIAKFTGVTPDNLAKAAIQANKLGLSLKDIGGVAEGLLDFQSSLNKEIEASILLGRDVNLTKARQLALDNDLEGLAIEITKQVGGETEFNKLNLIQRKALAESLNISVEQLSKVVTNQDKVKSINDAIAGTKPFEELLGRDSLDNITKIVNDFKTIGASLVNTIGPTVSFIAGGIASFTQFLSETPLLIKTISGALTFLAARQMMLAVGAIFGGFGKLGLIGIPLAIAAVQMMKSEVSGAKQMASAQDGLFTNDIVPPGGEAPVNVHRNEVITPLDKLGDFIADAMKPLVEENIKLRQATENTTAAVAKIGAQTAAALREA